MPIGVNTSDGIEICECPVGSNGMFCSVFRPGSVRPVALDRLSAKPHDERSGFLDLGGGLV